MLVCIIIHTADANVYKLVMIISLSVVALISLTFILFTFRVTLVWIRERHGTGQHCCTQNACMYCNLAYTIKVWLLQDIIRIVSNYYRCMQQTRCHRVNEYGGLLKLITDQMHSYLILFIVTKAVILSILQDSWPCKLCPLCNRNKLGIGFAWEWDYTLTYKPP